MSERKTAEIKFRVSPDEKARWQQYAEHAQLGLSELIRREVNESIRSSETKQDEEWAEQNAQLGDLRLITKARLALEAPVVVDAEVADLDPEWRAFCILADQYLDSQGDSPVAPQCSPGGQAACVFPECGEGACKPRIPIVTSKKVPPSVAMLINLDADGFEADAAPSEDVPTSDAVGALKDPDGLGLENCDCGRPQWAYCEACRR